ncbi:Uncharacterised protein [Vibrio cholerae]|nr:Uncharacterised protein [Vibrio cholerae]
MLSFWKLLDHMLRNGLFLQVLQRRRPLHDQHKIGVVSQ